MCLVVWCVQIRLAQLIFFKRNAGCRLTIYVAMLVRRPFFIFTRFLWALFASFSIVMLANEASYIFFSLFISIFLFCFVMQNGKQTTASQ